MISISPYRETSLANIAGRSFDITKKQAIRVLSYYYITNKLSEKAFEEAILELVDNLRFVEIKNGLNKHSIRIYLRSLITLGFLRLRYFVKELMNSPFGVLLLVGAFVFPFGGALACTLNEGGTWLTALHGFLAGIKWFAIVVGGLVGIILAIYGVIEGTKKVWSLLCEWA